MIILLDPALNTENSGDFIIQAASHRVLEEADIPYRSLTTRTRWNRSERELASRASFFVVGGTNLLSSHAISYRQWKFGISDLGIMRGRVVTLGVGWWQYQGPPDFVTTKLWRSLLHDRFKHSVRDSYTASKLSSMGVKASVTGCHTMWGLPPQLPVNFNSKRFASQTVVATLTDYSKQPALDQWFLQRLHDWFAEVKVWPQGKGDEKYVGELGFRETLISPGVGSLNQFLEAPQTVYIGTRLHAGIRALQLGVPTLVIGVDNRAVEISKDFGLPMLPRNSLPDLWLSLNERSWVVEQATARRDEFLTNLRRLYSGA